MSETKVVNIRHGSKFDVYIGRASINRKGPWGNPHQISPRTSRDQAVNLYEDHLCRQITAGDKTRQDLLELQGKRLGCWCYPHRCHGDILAKWAGYAVTMTDKEFVQHAIERLAEKIEEATT